MMFAFGSETTMKDTSKLFTNSHGAHQNNNEQ